MSKPVRLSAFAFLVATSACVGGGGYQLGSSGGPNGSGPPPSGGGASAGGASGSSGDSSGGGLQPAAGPAAPQLDDFAFEVKEVSSSWNKAFVISKLTTLEVGPACLNKMVHDKDRNAVGRAMSYARNVATYAQMLTGNEWERIETQSNNDRLNNLKYVEPMVDAFKASFSMTINVEGDDCDVSNNSFWLRYWIYISDALVKYPPRGGKAFITLNVSSSARDITSTVDATGTVFVFTGPKDIEPPPPSWPDRIEKPFRRVSSKG
ncbi:MAG: hypothetical protein H0T42_04635 [Deltaproteobacteria bacterium]|nr:hypothetical protein [Deltaproteobacteria bacterium]